MTLAIQPLTCDNESGLGGVGSTSRGLTHLSDLGGRGLGMSLPIEREQWRPIPGYEGLYEASSRGAVRAVAPTRKVDLLTPIANKDGYLFVRLTRRGIRKRMTVHKAVLLAFVGEPEAGQQCRHLNGIRTDNRPENLAWGSAWENSQDVLKHGTHPKASKTHCPQGHPYAGDNLLVYPQSDGRDGLGRVCRRCRRERPDRRFQCPDCGREMWRKNFAAHRRNVHAYDHCPDGLILRGEAP